MSRIESFIERLPKVELHLHLVGSASISTVLELARQYPRAGLPESAAGMRAFYEFRDFPHFAEVYEAVSAVVRRPEDIMTLVLGAVRDLKQQNARYVEMTVTPYTHVRAGMSMPAITEALDLAAREARGRYGVRVAYVFDLAGELGEPAARATLKHALEHPPERLVGFGLAGIEQERPRHRDLFREVFAAATAAGLHSVPHAGEMSGPEAIWEAVDGLRAERIGHGISCLADPALVDRLREAEITLEVCPISNVRTRQVPGLAAHPLPRLLAEGLRVTLGSDDPPMFGTTLNGQYEAAAALGLDEAALAELARAGVRAAYLDETAKAAILAEIDAAARPRTVEECGTAGSPTRS